MEFSYNDRTKTVEDGQGVIYSGDGGILLGVNRDRFNACAVTVPAETRVIWDGAFEGLDCLEEVTLDGGGSLEYIGEFAFEGCRNLRAICLPDSVVFLGQCAFRRCTGLEKVHIPRRLKSVPCECFMHCESLAEVDIPEGLETFEICSFHGCRSLRRIEWPKSLKHMADTAFCRTGLEEAILPEGVRFIGEDMFRGCPNLRRVVIPTTVEDIIPWTASSGPSFKGITCLSPYFRVEKDALIRISDGTILCCWTRQKTYTIPDGVMNIAGFTSSEVIEVICRHPLGDIGYDCFCGCEKLRKVRLAGVAEIAPSAFYGLEHVSVSVGGIPVNLPM